MQDIGSNMEELFRRAAENYPLKPGVDHWDLVYAQIAAGSQPVKRTSRYLKYALLAALLLLFFILGYFMSRFDGRGVGKDLSNVETKNRVKDHPALKENKPAGRVNNQKNKNIGTREGNLIENNFRAGEDKHIQNAAMVDQIEKNDHISVSVQVSKRIADGKAGYKLLLPGAYTTRIYPPSSGSFFNAALTNDHSIAPLPQKKINTEKPYRKVFSQKFYYGFLAGGSISSVKSSGIKKTGYELGFLLGYQFNDKLSLETALSYSKKQYPSKGEYFDGKNMPQGMNVMKLQGSSYVFQLPVYLRYNLKNTSDKRIFLAAGLNSFLLVTEQNDYDLMVSGAAQQMNAMYKKDRQYLAGSVQLSVGYEKTIFNRNSIRLEPFMQIPLRGTGVGELAVTTAGIRAGFRRGAD
jgi:hypothetical protein